MPIIITREVLREDAEAVAKVFKEAFLPLRSVYRPANEVEDRQVDHSQGVTRLVALIEGQVVGTVEFDRHIDHLHVVGLAVRPNFQRQGVARAMVDWIEAHAAESGRKFVTLKTIKEAGNVLVFEKLGFSISHEEVTSCFVSEEFSELREVRMERAAKPRP